MSADRLFRVAVARAGNATQVRVVAEIARLERKYGKATPSRFGMATRCGRSERSISRAVVALEAAGVLRAVRERPHRRADGTYRRARTTLYRLTWPPRHPVDSASSQVTPTGHACPVYSASRSNSYGRGRGGPPGRRRALARAPFHGAPPPPIDARLCPDGCTVCDDTGWEGRDPANGRCLA